MSARERTGDGQPESGAAGGTGEVVAHAIEAVEDPFVLLGRDGIAVVADPDLHAVADRFGLDPHGVGGVAQRIADEGAHDPLERIAGHAREDRRHQHLDPGAVVLLLGSDDVLDDGIEPAHLDARGDTGRFDAPGEEQVVHELFQPSDLVLHRLEHPVTLVVLHVLVAVPEQPDEPLQRCQRRPQFVRDGPEEVLLEELELPLPRDVANHEDRPLAVSPVADHRRQRAVDPPPAPLPVLDLQGDRLVDP